MCGRGAIVASIIIPIPHARLIREIRIVPHAQVHFGIFSQSAYSQNTIGNDAFLIHTPLNLLSDLSTSVEATYTNPAMTLTGLDLTVLATVYVGSASAGSAILRINGDDGGVLVNVDYVDGSSSDLQIDVRYERAARTLGTGK